MIGCVDVEPALRSYFFCVQDWRREAGGADLRACLLAVGLGAVRLLPVGGGCLRLLAVGRGQDWDLPPPPSHQPPPQLVVLPLPVVAAIANIW